MSKSFIIWIAATLVFGLGVISSTAQNSPTNCSLASLRGDLADTKEHRTDRDFRTTVNRP
jgi:hypothetical protein